MKKTNGYNNVNRNNPFNPFDRSSYPINTIASDIVLRQLWHQDNTPQVEIIELNSDSSEGELNNEEDGKYGHIWNYINNNLNLDDLEHSDGNHPRDREKQYTQNGNGNPSRTKLSPEDIDNVISDVVTDFVYSSFNGGDNYTANYITKNRQRNCFTIINKPFNSSDSSSDDAEVIEFNDKQDIWDNRYVNNDMISLDEGIENQKSTIWIYSIKNKHQLSDNQFELVNVPSQDCSSSTSNSFENFSGNLESAVKETPQRVCSPIPATYVPRLNLMSPRLPTLTEVTEPDKTIEQRTIKEKPIGHKVNGWCDDTRDKIRSAKHTEIINWMCLSPREKRRSKYTYSNPIPSVKSSVLETESKFDNSFRETPTFNKIETKVEINVTPDENIIQDRQSHSSSRNSFDSHVNYKKEVPLLLTYNIDDDNNCESGAEYKKSLRKPKILIPSKNVKKIKEISNPIERLDSNNWIHEEKKEHCLEKNQHTERFIQIETSPSNQSYPQDCAGNRLWARNRALLKPAEWKEYQAITGSIPSLQLSMDSSVENKSWLNRLAACFKCCK